MYALSSKEVHGLLFEVGSRLDYFRNYFFKLKRGGGGGPSFRDELLFKIKPIGFVFEVLQYSLSNLKGLC